MIIGSDSTWPIVTQQREIAELLIRHAHEFDEEPPDAVDDEEQRRRRHHGPRLSAIQPEDEKQHHAFQERLVKLARVPRLAVDDDGPWRVRARRLTPQLAVDEVADTPREQSECRPRRDEIHDDEERLLDVATVQPHRRQHAEEAAVERHAALPHFEDGERIGDHFAESVDQHVADAAADDRAERHVENDVVDVLGFDLAPGLLGMRARAEPAEREADEIHDPVPAHLERAKAEQGPDREGNRIEMRIRKQTAHSRLNAR